MQALETLGIRLKEQVSLNELLSENFNPRLYGLTKSQQEKVSALRDVLTTYTSMREELTGKKVRDAKDAVQVAEQKLRTLDHEELWVAYLNRDNVVISFEMIFKGSLDSVNISHRQIIAKALSKNASNLILFHNHPSGNPTPSISDINQTRMLTNACKTMEMQLLDHIVIGSGSYYSFADECTAKYMK